MKVELDTKDKAVHVIANDRTMSLEIMDKWINALRVARRWLKQQSPEQTK